MLLHDDMFAFFHSINKSDSIRYMPFLHLIAIPYNRIRIECVSYSRVNRAEFGKNRCPSQQTEMGDKRKKQRQSRTKCPQRNIHWLKTKSAFTIYTAHANRLRWLKRIDKDTWVEACRNIIFLSKHANPSRCVAQRECETSFVDYGLT